MRKTEIAKIVSLLTEEQLESLGDIKEEVHALLVKSRPDVSDLISPDADHDQVKELRFMVVSLLVGQELPEGMELPTQVSLLEDEKSLILLIKRILQHEAFKTRVRKTTTEV